MEEYNLVTADIAVESIGMYAGTASIDEALNKVNLELKRYTSTVNTEEYALAVLSGIISGAIDAIFVGEIRITGRDIGLAHQQVNNFIQEYAKARGYERARLKDAIGDLEDSFGVAQDNVWKGAGIKVSAKNHHLADLAHHPTPLGLVAAIIVQFLRIGTFVNRNGEWQFLFVETAPEDVIQIFAPAIFTGIMNWLVSINENEYERETGKEVPRELRRLTHIVASTPIIVEIAKCVDNWFGHLVSDMGGSKNTAGGGMGIPGVFVSFLYELSGLPGLKETNLPAFVNNLYEKQKVDLRHELAFAKAAGRQAISVVINELFVRTGYFVSRLAQEITTHNGLKGIEWSNIVPFNNRSIDRMLTVASMTFSVADTADAAVHAALESGGNWVLFAGRFVTRFNYVGAGRAAVSIVREISSEMREAQLIHEKMILTEAKTQFALQELEIFKAKLEEQLSDYIADDIKAFMIGFDYMNHGIASGDSNLVIKGNIVIQTVLGRKPQFTSQEEFDDLMDSEIPFVF